LKKILHIIPSLRKGGAERLVLDILKQFNKLENIQAYLVIFRNEIEYDITLLKRVISVVPSSIHLSLTKKWNINVSELQKFIIEFKPDIIHTHLFEAELVSRFCKYPQASWFSHLHDNMVQLNNFSKSSLTKNKITNWYEKQILFNQYKKNGGTHFIAISKHTESYINSVQSKYPVTLLQNAIDLKRFQKPNPSQTPLTTNHSPLTTNYSPFTTNDSPLTTNHSPLTLNLINVGSFTENKNQQFLIDVIIELNNKGFRVNFYFLGQGEYLNKVKNKALELGVQEQCQFIGSVENVEEFLWKSEVYVHVAKSEALGLTLIEAMAAGLPVVTLDGGGNRDLMMNGKNGFLIENQDPYEFADRIIEVFQNKEISEFNAEFAKQFDIESYCEKLLNLYKQELCVKSNPSFCQQSPSTIYD
jgi:glycosyltransferase involved in cell wall biosynthesis